MTSKAGFALLVMLLSVLACRVGQPVVTATFPALPAASPLTSTSLPSSLPTRAPASTVPPPEPALPPGHGAPVLQILSPEDGAIVSTFQIEVNGITSPGAIVSVNDDIIVTGTDGRFQSTVSLDEGPNLIEIIASNDAGDETSIELTVTYEP